VITTRSWPRSTGQIRTADNGARLQLGADGDLAQFRQPSPGRAGGDPHADPGQCDAVRCGTHEERGHPDLRGVSAGEVPGDDHRDPGAGTGETSFSSLLEDSAEDLYENAPCGYLSTLLDGQIAKINTTLLTWLGYRRDQLVGRCYLSDLLTVGGKIYYETHLAPLVSMQGEVRGVALELQAADGARLPVLITSVVKTDASGEPILVRTTVFDARDRRAYERELLRARQEAEGERARLQQLVATLQQSLLPPALPVVTGLDAAAHYQIASADEVGGDFYDLFPLSQDRWGVALGDVCGKGAHAATMTSLIRYTLRTAAVYDASPSAVLGTPQCRAAPAVRP
jgi:sigma-B regulation protein RsbU (phosphoserine phosphatase)